MALIHYYKFNGNLYDSIGAFDLLADINTPVYVPGKLGGSTGAVTSSSASFYRFGCTGTGGAASGFMASDTTEAANGVLSWSMTGWVYLTSFATQLIQLLSGTAGQSTATLGYDQKAGALTFNGTTAACSSGAWVFFTIRVTGGASYLSVNGGAESMTTWTTNMMAGGKSLFNGIRIGSPTAFSSLYAYIDDVRVFNHSLSSGEIAGIYNGGSPAEATARTSNYKSTYRHFKFNSSLSDINARTPSVAATVSVGSYTYTSGIAASTDQSIRVLSAGALNGSLEAVPAGNFYIGSSQTANDSFGYSWWMSNSSGTYHLLQLFQICDFEANSSNWKIYASSGTINIADSDPYSLHKSFFYDGISRRFLYYQNSILKYEYAGTVATYTRGFYAYTSSSIGSAFLLDDVRFYGGIQAGLEVLDIYNSGNGTEVDSQGESTGSGATITMTAPAGSGGGTINGSATGAGVSITMTAPVGAAIVPTNGSATGAGATVTMAPPAGAAIIPTNGSATGAGVTVTMVAPTGIAFIPVNASATGTGRTITMVAPAGTVATSWITEPIPAVTMVPPEGRVQIGAETIGPTILVTIPPAGLGAGGGSASGTGQTVTMTAPAGSATGTAARSGTLGTVAMTAAAGTAAGSAAASGAPGTIPATAPTGGATGTAAIAAAVATVTVTTTAGSATGTAAAGGALATIPVSATAGSATGTAAATGAGQTVTLSAPSGALTASAAAAGNLATVTVAAPTATETGGATASPAGVTVATSAPAGGSVGTATGTGAISTATMTAPGGAAQVSVAATGSAPTVAMVAAAGTATGTASTAGSGATVAMAPAEGVARASVVAGGAPGTAAMAAPAGSAAGTLTAPLATITMVAPTGAAQAIIYATGNIGTITMAAPGAGTITASATGSPSGVTVSVIAPAARVVPITTGGGASVSTYDLRRAGTNL